MSDNLRAERKNFEASLNANNSISATDVKMAELEEGEVGLTTQTWIKRTINNPFVLIHRLICLIVQYLINL